MSAPTYRPALPIFVGDQKGGPERTVSTSLPHSVFATPDCTLSV